MDILLYWFMGAVLTGWGIYDLLDYRQTKHKRKRTHGIVSSVLGVLLLAGAYLS